MASEGGSLYAVVDLGIEIASDQYPSLYVAENIGIEVTSDQYPSLYFAENIGIEVASDQYPSLYFAQNIGASLVGFSASYYGVANVGDWNAVDLSVTLGPEFTFPPILRELQPAFGQVGSEVHALGVGFGDEKTFVRWQQLEAAGDAFADGAVLSASSPWTVESWVRAQRINHHSVAGATTDGEIVTLRLTAGDLHRYGIEWVAGKFRLSVANGASTVDTDDAYDEGDWHHVVAVYDGTDIILYVDGVPKKSLLGVGDVTYDKVVLANGAQTDQRETRIVRAEVYTALFAPAWDYVDVGSTSGHWKMEDGSGTTLVDHDASSADLTISGSDFRWIDWEFDLTTTLAALGQSVDEVRVRNYDYFWTVTGAAVTGPVQACHTILHAECSNQLGFVVLPQAPLELACAEVRVYDKSDWVTLDAILENAFDVSFVMEENEPGSGTFKIHMSDPKAVFLVYDAVIKIAIDQVERFAFVIEDIKQEHLGDDDESGRVYTISGRGLLSVLERAVVYPPNWPSFDPPFHLFGPTNVGEMFETLIKRAIGRGVLPPAVGVGFDDVTDSAGVPWGDLPLPNDVDLLMNFHPGTSYKRVQEQFAKLGYVCNFSPGLNIELYKNFGVDRTTGSEPTLFEQGHTLVAEDQQGQAREVRNVVLSIFGDVDGGSPGMLEVVWPASTFPRREAYLDVRNAENATTAQRLSLAALQAVQDSQEQFTGEVVSISGQTEAFVDWNLGDTVLINIPGTLDLVPHRIITINFEETDDGFKKYVLTFNDLRYDAIVRLSKKVAALSGGGEIASASVGVPSAMGTIPHNIISITHADVDPDTPPAEGLVLKYISGRWTAVVASVPLLFYISFGDNAAGQQRTVGGKTATLYAADVIVHVV